MSLGDTFCEGQPIGVQKKVEKGVVRMGAMENVQCRDQSAQPE